MRDLGADEAARRRERFPPAADTVVVDERPGRLADRVTGRRPELFALTGAGGDTMEVIGTPGRDHYVARDDLGASIDLDAHGRPDFVSTDVGRVVLRGMAGDDLLSDGRSGRDRLACGPGRDTVRARSGDTVTECERSLPRRHP